MVKAPEFDIVQGVWPGGHLRLDARDIGDCVPGVVVKSHVCDGCRSKGGEIYVALVGRDGKQLGAIMFPPEQAHALAESLIVAVGRISPGAVN